MGICTRQYPKQGRPFIDRIIWVGHRRVAAATGFSIPSEALDFALEPAVGKSVLVFDENAPESIHNGNRWLIKGKDKLLGPNHEKITAM